LEDVERPIVFIDRDPVEMVPVPDRSDLITSAEEPVQLPVQSDHPDEAGDDVQDREHVEK
jgi:hypothetical protein